MKRAELIDTAARTVFHSALAFSLYLLFTGHNQPGGGFVGGLVAAAAFALVYVAGGIEDVRNMSRLRPWTILGGGLFLATAAAIVPVVAGSAPLESNYLEFSLPLLGTIKMMSTLVFDLGVYVSVLALVTATVLRLGRDGAGR